MRAIAAEPARKVGAANAGRDRQHQRAPRRCTAIADARPRASAAASRRRRRCPPPRQRPPSASRASSTPGKPRRQPLALCRRAARRRGYRRRGVPRAMQAADDRGRHVAAADECRCVIDQPPASSRAPKIARADAHFGRALGDRELEIRRHAHRQRVDGEPGLPRTRRSMPAAAGTARAAARRRSVGSGMPMMPRRRKFGSVATYRASSSAAAGRDAAASSPRR